MTLRSDHIAGAAFIVFGLAVFAISGDLPFGNLSSPGAGMMPKLLLVLMIVFGLTLIFSAARSSQPFADIDWSDRNHALLVVAIAAAAISVYQWLGFLLTMSLLVFTLLIVVERKNVLRAAAYSICLTGIAWWVFGTALKSPLETGVLGF